MTAYYAQDVTASLDPELDILETIAQVSENTTVPYLRGLLGSFLFTGDDVFKKVGVLSGGEKSRVCLAKILSAKFNFIILDEPTNHLDISSKKILQKALSDFEGSLVLVSHDVDFLRPIVNKVVRIERGLFRQYEDGIDYYLLKRSQESASQQQNSARQKKQSSDSSRRDIKRLEAELRQEKHNRTKDIKKKLEKAEAEIAQFEVKQKSLEDLLADPTLYQRPDELKKANAGYKEIKEKLAKVYTEWEHITLKLDEIDREFAERLNVN
jgi:ATP-binding cassette subfamily F protein 3